MSLNKKFTSLYQYVGPRTYSIMTDSHNGEDVLSLVFENDGTGRLIDGGAAVGIPIKDVAALHAILGNWLKKRDRRVGVTERRGNYGRRHGSYMYLRSNSPSSGRRKGDAL